MENKNSPAVSIIIPMYNVEKYIAGCLDSILEQTLKNFEVILVDDCSTDNSRSIAENYLTKFDNNQFKFIALEKNHGNPATPRNIALQFARGEYILFVDSDDAITPTALEELYSTAKELDADILSCRRFYMFNGESVKNPRRISIRGVEIKKPVPVSDPVVAYSRHQFFVMTWTHFYKRELIVKNKIEFPNIPMTEDSFFVFFALAFAKKVFRIPNVYYYYRKHAESITAGEVPVYKYLQIRIESVVSGLKVLEAFDKEHEIFKDRPEIKYATANRIVNDIMSPAIKRNIHQKISAQEFDEIIQNALQKIDDSTFLTTFLFKCVTNLKGDFKEKDDNLKKLQEEIQKLKENNSELQNKLQSISDNLQDEIQKLKNLG